MTNTSMSSLERQQRQGAITGVMSVWIYDGAHSPDDLTRWAQHTMRMQDVLARIPLHAQEWRLRHLLTPVGRSHLVLAGPNLLEDFRKFLKDRQR